MCFSPTASFTAAAVIGALGLVAVSRARTPSELPLAMTPLLFAAQQALEGFIWLRLPIAPQGAATGALILTYLVFAQVLWPVWGPAAMLCLEQDPRRRRLMAPWLAVGVAVSAYLLWGLLSRGDGASIAEGHISYETGQVHLTAAGAGYLAAIGLPPLMSSSRSVLVFGIIVMFGWIVAYIAYQQAFQSVWCFFAAAASVVLVAHFEFVRRQVPGAAAALGPTA